MWVGQRVKISFLSGWMPIILSNSKSKYFYFTRKDHSVYTGFQLCPYINFRTIYKTRHTHVMIKDLMYNLKEIKAIKTAL